MKISLLLICAVGLFCFSADAEANPGRPGAPGNYKIFHTYDGTLSPGRMSEFSPGDSPGMFVSGNVICIMSWDGDSHGSQWQVLDAIVDDDGAVITANTVDDSGTGYIDYTIGYSGGRVWFDHSYFSDGIIGPGAQIDWMRAELRFSYHDHVIVGVTCNIIITCAIDDCPQCHLQFEIVNGMNIWKLGDTDSAPEGYPEYSSGAETNSLWDLCCIMMTIACDAGLYDCYTVGVEETSWGTIKTLHR